MQFNPFKKFVPLFFLLLSIFFLSGCTFVQYIAHYANQYGWKTKLTIKNGNPADTDITLEFYDNEGNKISTATFTLPAHGSKTDYVENFFPDSIPDTGSIKIISTEEGIVSKISSIILFEHSSTKGDVCLAGLQGARIPSTLLSFPWFENSTDYTTGIAILNTSNYDVVATMRACDGNGNCVYSKPIKLKPMQRIIGFASDFFNEQIPSMATMDVYATGKVAGFIIMYNGNLTKAEAINGVENEKCKYPRYIIYTTNNETSILQDFGICIKESKDLNKIYISERDKGIRICDKSNLNNNILIQISQSFYGKFDVSPDGRRLVVSNRDEDKLLEVNLEDKTVSEIDSLSNPWSVAFSNDGNYLAVGTADGNIILYKVNIEDHTYTQNLSFHISGGYICDIIFSEDSHYLVAIDYNLNKLYYYDLTSKGTLQEKDLPISVPSGICQSKYDGTYYICSMENKVCKLTDLSLNPTTFEISTNYAQSIAASEDGKYLFIGHGIIAHDQNGITIVDLSNNHSDRFINLQKFISSILFSTDDLLLYYSGNELGYIY